MERAAVLSLECVDSAVWNPYAHTHVQSLRHRGERGHHSPHLCAHARESAGDLLAIRVSAWLQKECIRGEVEGVPFVFCGEYIRV